MDRIRKFIVSNKDVLFCFLGSKLLFAAVLLIVRTPYSEVLGFFDAGHYRDIASMGYYVDGVTVFFPVIPLIIRYLGDVGLIVINQLSYITALYFLKQILIKLKEEGKVSTVLAIAAVSPLALFTSLEYTESIYFMLTIIAFYLFVNDKLPALMGIILGLSVATRNTGSMLFFAIFTGYVIRMITENNKGKRIKDIFLCFVPATAISLIYPVYLQIKFNNWKVFMDAQYTYWVRIPSNIFKTVFTSLEVIFTNKYQFDGAVDTLVLFKINEVLSLGFMILVIVLIVREILIMRRQGRINIPSIVAIIYCALFIVALGMTIRDPNIDCPTDSFYRYYLTLFPVYLGIGRLKERGIQLFMFGSIILTMITCPAFCMGGFFF